MRFASSGYLFLVFAMALLAAFWWLADKSRKAKLDKAFSKENQEALGLVNTNKKAFGYLYRLLCLSFLGFLTLALARPQLGARQASSKIEEHSVVFLLDLSRSMLTQDVSPSRIELMRREILKTLNSLGDIRVGLVIFAGNVEVISPMTSDLSAVSSYIESLSTNSVSSQGTNLLKALQEAAGVFERSSYSETKKALAEETKVIVVFSDGEDHQKESLQTVEKMADNGYRIFSVGVGSESGGYIPESEASLSYIKDESGQTVVSKPNFKFLKEVAKKGKGAFYFLNPSAPLGPKLESALSKVGTKVSSKRDFVIRNEVYQVFLALAFLSLILLNWIKRLK